MLSYITWLLGRTPTIEMMVTSTATGIVHWQLRDQLHCTYVGEDRLALLFSNYNYIILG